MRMLPVKFEGWGGFAAWAFVGALLSLSFLGAASIGLFILPVALLALLLVTLMVRPWPEGAGLLEGMAALVLFVGLAHVGSTPCPETGSHTVLVGEEGRTWSCGGWEPLPWLLVGLALAAVGLAVYALARYRS
ncbi:MAG: hypothetical protein M3144_10825 [Actinomycetota bacterium]|nr:hypothetical protein [Actinomycetota bacterium]